MSLHTVTVFCGSSYGNDPVYEQQARLLGKTLAQRHIRLVYGGARVGLMGALADEVLQNGGTVTGVLPRFLQEKEIAHQHLTRLVLVENMHERKKIMDDLCDGIIALPGGFGTMEEFFEMLTWAQLGLHKKPVALLNVNGFYDALNRLVATMTGTGFLKEANRDMLLESDNIDTLLHLMETYKAPIAGKWIEKKQV